MITEADAGCWIDGHWGQYSTSRLVMIAIGEGWDDDQSHLLASVHLNGNRELTDDEYDYLMDAADDAEFFLQSLAPEGFSFGWWDGEFFLWFDAQWEDGWGE